jgi:tetratricopeptide (TPR) repeat protein
VALESQDPKELDVVAQQYRGREVGQWAAVLAGDMHLEAGCNELFQNKANAVEDLRKAVESYLLALESASSSPLRERATFGLARAYEALAGTRQSQGELSKAIEQYRKVVQDWPDGTYAVIAQRRLMDLEKPSTKAFYDQFAKYEPKPPVSPGLGTGNIPFDTETLGPDQQLPDLSKILGPNGAEKPGSEGKTPDTGKAETPAPAGSQPAPAAKPEPAKPASAAEAKGAAQGTPEEPKPAESKPAAPAESKAR